MNLLIKDLKKKNILDYKLLFFVIPMVVRCAITIYPLLILSHKHSIRIERIIGAPGHEKGYVDDRNAVDKQYLKKIVMLIKIPQ